MSQLVEGILSSTWVFGAIAFIWMYELCSIITVIETFFSALVFGDWIEKYDSQTVKCFNWVYDYY